MVTIELTEIKPFNWPEFEWKTTLRPFVLRLETEKQRIARFKHLQVRQHRKVRINKKWAKRYGYKTKPIICTNFKELKASDDHMLDSVRYYYAGIIEHGT